MNHMCNFCNRLCVKDNNLIVQYFVMNKYVDNHGFVILSTGFLFNLLQEV